MKRLAVDSMLHHPAEPDGPHAANNWRAELSLGFTDDAGTTRLTERRHTGPLRVQKPLYPEGPAVCHAIVVHPPGGVVGGDELAIAVRVGDHAHALLTTPGAAKWYKANERISRQNVQLELAQHATLEWLPQETIFFNAAHVRLENTILLGADSRYLGFEILCFGRTASGETFETGKIEQRTTIRRDGKLIWFEQGALTGGSTSMTSPLALAGTSVCATLTAAGAGVPSAVIDSLREEATKIAGDTGAFGMSQLKSVLVARYLGNSSETAKQLMTHAWQRLRPALLGRDAVVPRIWNT
jgi:urease accessory protein